MKQSFWKDLLGGVGGSRARAQAGSLTHVIALLDREECAGARARYVSKAQVIPLSRYRSLVPRPPVERWRIRWNVAAVWAMVVLDMMILPVLAWRQPNPPGDYVSGIGERRFVPLAEGSSATLNTQSHLKVNFSPQAREVELLDGESLFTAAPDAKRPLKVRVGRAVVQAAGARFRMYRTQRDVTISVLEGRVDLIRDSESSRMSLEANEEVRLPLGVHGVNAGIQWRRVSLREWDQRLAWLGGQIVLEGETLSEAVQDFNRYNRRKLRITDPALAGLRVGGTFESTDTDSFLAALRALYGISTAVRLEASPRGGSR